MIRFNWETNTSFKLNTVNTAEIAIGYFFCLSKILQFNPKLKYIYRLRHQFIKNVGKSNNNLQFNSILNLFIAYLRKKFSKT